MDSPYRPELLAAIGAVQQAAKLSQSLISSQDKGTIQKDDLSPVTVGDFAIQALLTAALHKAFPDDGFVGEESADELRTDSALCERVWNALNEFATVLPESKEQMLEMIDWCGLGVPHADKKRVWVFDPIDGTKTFVEKKMYAINVALLESGKQVLSVVACPVLAVDARAPLRNDLVDPTGRGSILFAVKGHGAYVRPLPGSIEEVEVRRLEPLDETLALADMKLVTSVHMADSGVDEVHKAVAEKLGVEYPGSDLLAWVVRWVSLALGLANVTVWVYKRRDRLAKIWDHAGAMLLFEEVGGKVTDVDGNDIDLGAGRKMTANYGWVAAPRHLHDDVLRAVRETLREQGRHDLLAQ
ncbi:carbohydrate phosphatase [Coniochaeta ligniaria NRRL 30616]|uniref:Carbohydrate phosphatase n=1 Tax=Coniochaeta ligniaria NRRL 30616 TaxID=1408157 RepID=A0A1J7JF54_9PEZI|nr:carbohydrate phosphatase [Coniochaeta ligniaria NRRL 30616]